MTKPLIKISAFLIISIGVFSQGTVNPKYDKWLMPSYFRGYNVIDEVPKTLADFIALKNYGGNFFSINTRGFFAEDPPYNTLNLIIASTDRLVFFCRQAGLHYNIAVRSGPGAYDTFLESIGISPESRIWNTGNVTEQQKYADMLKFIVQRYSNDTLFVGLTLVVEPRPKFRDILANTSDVYKANLEDQFDIHMDVIYNNWISQIREVDADLPIIVESFAFSTPELFPPYEVNDEFVVYSTHNYQPVEYTRQILPFTVNYPGVYWNITYLSQQLYDSSFMANTVFTKVNSFHDATGKPIFLGEFGIIMPQNGSPQYIKDVLTIVKSKGWHFALWDWRRGSGAAWDIEGFVGDNKENWKTVLNEFHPPPVPGLISPANEEIIFTLTPVFIWDSLTSYTKYDMEIVSLRESVLFENIDRARYSYDGPPLIGGRTYGWHVRSKNPDGGPENTSGWSALKYFTVSAIIGISNNKSTPKEFMLYQNYPNPFNPVTVIRYDLPVNSNVKIRIYDINGRLVKEVVNGFRYSGEHSVEYDATLISSGVYYYRIDTDFTSVTKKMVVVK